MNNNDLDFLLDVLSSKGLVIKKSYNISELGNKDAKTIYSYRETFCYTMDARLTNLTFRLLNYILLKKGDLVISEDLGENKK